MTSIVPKTGLYKLIEQTTFEALQVLDLDFYSDSKFFADLFWNYAFFSCVMTYILIFVYEILFQIWKIS